MKLVQKRFLKGSREFEIVEDTIQMRINTIRMEKELVVKLAIINPEPVVNGEFLDFLSRVNNDPLLSLFIDNPDSETCNRFVEQLRRRAREAYREYTGIRTGAGPGGLAANSYEEPPEFDEAGHRSLGKPGKAVRPGDIDTSIRMLQQYLAEDELEALIASLLALKNEPDNAAHLDQLAEAFDALGSRQGAVLTYAPYVGLLLSDDPFAF